MLERSETSDLQGRFGAYWDELPEFIKRLYKYYPNTYLKERITIVGKKSNEKIFRDVFSSSLDLLIKALEEFDTINGILTDYPLPQGKINPFIQDQKYIKRPINQLTFYIPSKREYEDFFLARKFSDYNLIWLPSIGFYKLPCIEERAHGLYKLPYFGGELVNTELLEMVVDNLGGKLKVRKIGYKCIR